MATQTQSFKLPRLANTTQIRKMVISSFETSQSQTLKLSARYSINRSVKYNDLSQITGMSLEKLRKQPQQVQNAEYQSAHSNLKQIRKKYDNLKKKRVQKDQNIQKFQNEKLSYKSVEDQLKQKKQKGQTQVANLQSNLEQMKVMLEQAETNKKVMLNMISRLKKDKITYDLRKYKMQKQLKSIGKEKETVMKSSRGLNEEDSNTKDIYQKYLNHLEEEEKQRQTHLTSVRSMIQTKISINQQNQIRKKEIISVAEEALEEKDSTEKNWEKIYLTNRFVDKMLREKIEIQMSKFNTVQNAFKIIKTATGVSDAETLVKKFLNKETVYGELLAKITENERRINQLKTEHEQMIKERKLLKDQNNIYQKGSKSNEDIQNSKQIKQFENISLRYTNDELLVKKIQQWLFRIFKKLNAVQNKKEKIKLTSDKAKIIEKFKYLLSILANAIQESKGNDKLFEQDGDALAEAKGEGLFRAKPKILKMNSSGEVVQDQFQEEEILNLNDQDNCLSNQRQETLKKNQKFMKELKKKYDDIKKAKLDAEPKKKEVIIQKPKNHQPLE